MAATAGAEARMNLALTALKRRSSTGLTLPHGLSAFFDLAAREALLLLVAYAVDGLLFDLAAAWFVIEDNKKRGPSGSRLASLLMFSLYHKAMGYWDIFAEIYCPWNHGDGFRRGWSAY